MAGEAASLTDMRNTAPAQQVAHRTAVAAADSGTPAVTAFAANSGWWPRCRVYCNTTFAGGTNPTLTLRVWVRKHIFGGEAAEQYGILQAPCDVNGQPATKDFTVTAAAGRLVFDVPANGDDLYVEVATVNGAPTSFAFTCALGWRA